MRYVDAVAAHLQRQGDLIEHAQVLAVAVHAIVELGRDPGSRAATSSM